ncbi:hypothetical protein ACQVP2_07665 [Methylobacterium aquaticum]|uniref:hypothetical protein n=1 Tax=Methylobacterium aquaticum TaxID=270351 RepID=UPI003D16E36D
MPATKIRIVRDPGPGQPFTTTRITCADPVAALRSCGFEATLPGTRLVLRGESTLLPRITNFLGPLMDGDAVRYEDAAVAAVLSR